MATLSTAPSPCEPPRNDERLSPLEAIELFAPISLLQVLASHGIGPQAGDVIGHASAPIAAGAYGSVSVGPIPKRQLNPVFTDKSGRVSRYPGDFELVALKSLHAVRTPGEDGGKATGRFPFEALLPELTLLSSPPLLYHDNIVDILGYYWEPAKEVDGDRQIQQTPTMILEFTELGSLTTYFAVGPSLSFRQRLDLCLDVCRALQTLHHEIEVSGRPLGLSHGDLKPQNILVFAQGRGVRAKLSDLGSCVRYDPSSPCLPRQQLGPGTRGWMAPERCAQPTLGDPGSTSQVDVVAADVFSFGLLATYILLGGRQLFHLEDVAFLLKDEGYYVDATTGNLDENNVVDAIVNAVGETLGTASAALQKAFLVHLDAISAVIKKELMEVLVAGGSTLDDTIRAIALVDATLVPDPEKRTHNFREIGILLGGDPGECRHRTPSERIINVLELQTSQLSLLGQIHATGALFLLPHSFRDFLCTHLEGIYHRYSGSAAEDMCQLAKIAAVFLGLQAFVPPEVSSKVVGGLAWLQRATRMDPSPQLATLYSRLAASHPVAELDLQMQHLSVHDETGLSVGCLTRGHDVQVEVSGPFQACFIWDLDQIKSLVERYIESGGQTDYQETSTPEEVSSVDWTYTPGQTGTALHWAVATNNSMAAKVLLGAGWDPYVPNQAGHSPWSLAVSARLPELLDVFLQSPVQAKDELRRESTELALCSPLVLTCLLCGGDRLERTMSTLTFLVNHGILSREKTHAPMASPGSSDPAIVRGLLAAADPEASLDPRLLLATLEPAIITGELEIVTDVLPSLPPQKVGGRAFLLLNLAIGATVPASDKIFALLLDHFKASIDLNATFTFAQIGPETRLAPLVAPERGSTLLHHAFSCGRISRAVTLLEHGADPTITSRDLAALTPLGQLVFNQTKHSLLAIQDLLASDYLAAHQTFLVENAVVRPAHNENIFHQLCKASEESRGSDPVNLTVLVDLVSHFRSRGGSGPGSRLAALLNTEAVGGLDGQPMSPLHQAAATGFWEAVRPLVRAGADPLLRIGADAAAGFDGALPLHMADTRSAEAWTEDFTYREALLRQNRFPWFAADSPTAQHMRREYEARTEATIAELKKAMMATDEGKRIWEKRRAARAERGLRVG